MQAHAVPAMPALVSLLYDAPQQLASGRHPACSSHAGPTPSQTCTAHESLAHPVSLWNARMMSTAS